MVSIAPELSQARPPAPQVDFAELLGPAAWSGLPPAVRHRFAIHELGDVAVYRGEMVVEASWSGRLLAQLLRPLGTPLAPWIDRAVPVEVRVYRDMEGVVWDRIYSFKGRTPLLVRSRKIAGPGGKLLEVVSGGLGMDLEVDPTPVGMVFNSQGYFWRILGLRVPILRILTPGAVVVTHEDLGGGSFRFSLDIRHPWLGQTFYQSGVFQDP